MPSRAQVFGNENSVFAKWLSVCHPKIESRGRQIEIKRERERQSRGFWGREKRVWILIMKRSHH